MADLNDWNKPTVADLRVDVQDTHLAHATRAIKIDPGTASNRPVGAKLAELISNVFTLKHWNGSAYDTWLTISNFWRGVLDDANASDAQTSLGATVVGKAVFIAANKAAARDALGKHAFRAGPTVSQSVTGTATLLQWGSEQFDSNGDFDSTTNHRFTAPVTGIYCFSCAVGFVFFAAGNVLIELQVGTTTVHRAKGKIDSADDQVNGAWVLSLSAGETVRIMVSGTVNAGISTTNESHFSGVLIG